MLCNWEPHEDYQKILLIKLNLFCETERSRVISMSNALSKLYLLDLDNLLPVIKPLLLTSHLFPTQGHNQFVV